MKPGTEATAFLSLVYGAYSAVFAQVTVRGGLTLFGRPLGAVANSIFGRLVVGTVLAGGMYLFTAPVRWIMNASA